MSKKLIYTFRVEDERRLDDGRVRSSCAYADRTLPTLKAYADNVGADLAVVERWHPDFQDMSLYLSKVPYLADFADQGYEKLLYIDLDMVIREHAPDIFDLVETGFGAVPAFSLRKRLSYRRWARRVGGLGGTRVPLLNGGLLLAGSADDARHLADAYRNRARQVFVASEGYKLGMDQPVTTLLVDSSQRPFTRLDRKWNRVASKARTGDYFIHYIDRQKMMLLEPSGD